MLGIDAVDYSKRVSVLAESRLFPTTLSRSAIPFDSNTQEDLQLHIKGRRAYKNKFIVNNGSSFL